MAESMGLKAHCKNPSMDLRILMRDRELRNQEVFFGHTSSGDLPLSLWMGVGITGYICTGKNIAGSSRCELMSLVIGHDP